ncbi:MAG TPA: hypothetical protein VMH92_04000 [Acidocella sp.]|nr:hypothetical protein [Acidocella sp.]
MTAIGYALQAAIGTGTYVDGLAGTQTTVPSLTINIGPGSIISLEEVDANAYGSLGTNTAPLVKMGINLAATQFTLTAPGTSGQSINYLVEAEFLEQDGTPIVLPYVNPSSPSTPYAGPGNAGTAQNTQRAQTVSLQIKAGAAATTGTQTTPATDSGWVPLYVITVNYGQTAITTAQITTAPGAPFITSKVGQAGWSNSLLTDTGTTNALAVTLNPAPASMAALVGIPLRVKVANTTTGAFTLNVNGLGAVSVIGSSGNALGAVTGINAALAGDIIDLVYNGTSFVYHTGAGRLINVQVFTASGTYTPTPGTQSVVVEVQAAGGGSGGVAATSSTQTAQSPPGTPGSYAKARYTSGFSGAAVTVGTGGAAGTSSTAGGQGGTSSFGALVSCPGGPGSQAGTASTTYNITIPGGASGNPSGSGIIVSSFGFSPQNTLQASYGISMGFLPTAAPMPGASAGSGASGVYQPVSQSAASGHAGTNGIVVVYEYA